ncbi:MAG: tetratricopeptide repeat protein, partial [Bacteroidales bacterium]|nr:tetratricopeptide repeat protein [Bacteroidales bacterium]
MQTPDEALEDRLESEEKIRATLIAELNKQKAELRRLKEEQRITQQEYNEKLKALYDAQSTNEKFISEMAERYSTMDFDQMDEFQSRVAYYIRNGELTRADSLLNTKGSMIERSAELDRMDAAIKADSEDIAQRQIAHNAAVEHKAKKLEDFAVDCYSRYEMCELQHKNDSAAFWLELRASKDSLNIEWQLDAGAFLYRYLADYERALKYYQTALTNALSYYGEEHPDVATNYNNIGEIYSSQGDYSRALEYHTKSFEILKKIFGEEHPDVATSYNNIGIIYSSQGDYSRALEYHTKS